VADRLGDRLLALAGATPLAGGEPHATTVEDLPLVGVVDRWQLKLAVADVVPHVSLGPIGDREDAHVLAGLQLAVVQTTQLGGLTAGVPATEAIADGEHALLGPCLLFVTASAAEDGVVTALLDGLDERDGLQRVTGTVRALLQRAAINPVLDVRDVQVDARIGGDTVAELQNLRVVV